MYYVFLSTILEEEKLQQEERMRMESRRQVTVSWDSGGSDEAPPKVAKTASYVCVPSKLPLMGSFKQWQILSSSANTCLNDPALGSVTRTDPCYNIILCDNIVLSYNFCFLLFNL